jgi:hypothetical protein
MKKYFAILLISLIAGFTSQAQEAVPEKKLSMKEEVGLSSEQDAQVKAIKEEYKGKSTAIEANAALDDKAKKAQKKALMAEREDKINALLSKEQQDKYVAYKEKLRAQKEAAGKEKH